MNKETLNNFPVADHIKSRWSPRSFISKPVEEEKISSITEAARWAPSAFNEQPWRFIVGRKGTNTYEMILSSLVEWNQKWAGAAPLLILNIGKKTFTHNDKPNVTFKYDLGQAVAFMAIEIVNQGLVSHQMSGFDPEKAAELLEIPDDYQAVSITAIGYQGKADELPADFREIEMKPRERNNIKDIVFNNKFGE